MRSEAVRFVAEHESAHCVLVAHFGYPVASVFVRRDGSGGTVWDAARASRAEQAAISAAGDVWDSELSDVDYRDIACEDLARLVRLVGVGGVWAARRAAREVLTARRRLVLSLADRLELDRRIVFEPPVVSGG